jgi:hypothetical protein
VIASEHIERGNPVIIDGHVASAHRHEVLSDFLFSMNGYLRMTIFVFEPES